MLAFIFIIFGTINFINIQPSRFYTTPTLLTIYAIWLLTMILLIIFTYAAIINHQHCIWMIFLLFVIALLFASCWAIQFTNNLDYANFSLILVFIFSLSIIYLTPFMFQILSIFYLLLWLGFFFYTNHLLN
jgi:hypothetical protein